MHFLRVFIFIFPFHLFVMAELDSQPSIMIQLRLWRCAYDEFLAGSSPQVPKQKTFSCNLMSRHSHIHTCMGNIYLLHLHSFPTQPGLTSGHPCVGILCSSAFFLLRSTEVMQLLFCICKVNVTVGGRPTFPRLMAVKPLAALKRPAVFLGKNVYPSAHTRTHTRMSI